MHAKLQFKKAFALCGLLATLLANAAMADDATEVSKLLRTGQLGEALARADGVLAQRPKDAQIRFLKGLILTEQNKTPEAIVVFTKLTEDFPDLPEPYNNLAVLFAAAGQYDKARSSLDMAIRTNPTYATAHENLGDVYAKLASQAYDKALQIDSSNANARSKLTMVRTLSGNTTGGTVPVKTVSAIPQPKAASPAQVPAAPMVALQQPAAKSTQPVPELKASTAGIQSEAPVASKKTEPNGREHEAVLEAMTSWAKAWSAQDLNAYLGSYASDFKTPGGVSRKTWEAGRRDRIEGKERISVKIDSPQVSINGNSATVRFRQNYSSDRLSSSSKKTIVLNKQGGKWLINQERAGS